jgi:hypothetical protein
VQSSITRAAQPRGLECASIHHHTGSYFLLLVSSSRPAPEPPKRRRAPPQIVGTPLAPPPTIAPRRDRPTSAEGLFLHPDQVTDSLHAYQLAKRGNSLVQEAILHYSQLSAYTITLH